MGNALVPTSFQMISQKVYNLATIIDVYYLGHTIELISTLKTLGITLWGHTILPTHSISHQRLNIVRIWKTSNLGEGVWYIMGAWQVLHIIFLLDVYWGPHYRVAPGKLHYICTLNTIIDVVFRINDALHCLQGRWLVHLPSLLLKLNIFWSLCTGWDLQLDLGLSWNKRQMKLRHTRE